MRDIEIPAQEFSGQIRVGVARIEQGDAVAQAFALLRQLLDFGLTAFKQLLVLVPGDDAAWPGDGESAQHQQAQLHLLLERELLWT